MFEPNNFPITEIDINYYNNNFYRNIEIINCCTNYNANPINFCFTHYIIMKREEFIYSLILFIRNYDNCCDCVTTETIYYEKENKIYMWYNLYLDGFIKYKITEDIIIYHGDNFSKSCEINKFNLIKEYISYKLNFCCDDIPNIIENENDENKLLFLLNLFFKFYRDNSLGNILFVKFCIKHYLLFCKINKSDDEKADLILLYYSKMFFKRHLYLQLIKNNEIKPIFKNKKLSHMLQKKKNKYLKFVH